MNPHAPRSLDMFPVQTGDVVERFDGQMARFDRRTTHAGRPAIVVSFNGVGHLVQDSEIAHWEFRYTAEEASA